MSGSAAPAQSILEIDQTNPCAVAAALRSAYYQLLAGEREVRIRFRNGETEEEVTYSPVNIEALKLELARKDADCFRLTSGGRTMRRCITAG